MSKNKETISLYMDGEASEFETAGIVKQLKQDHALRCCWEGYHLIGDALRNHLSSAITAGFSERMAVALEREPVHFSSRQAPRPRANDTAGFALAASVSAVAIVGLLQFAQPTIMASAAAHYETDIQSQRLAMVDQASQQIDRKAAIVDSALNIEMDNQALAYASFDGDMYNMPGNMSASTANESTMYDYLVNYSQYAVAAPLEGSAPAVSLVSYRMD